MITLVKLQVKDVLLRLLDILALERILLRNDVVKTAAERPGVRVDTKLLTFRYQFGRAVSNMP